MLSKEIYVDIDGTICQTHGIDYVKAEPLPARIDKINSLYDAGNRIVYWTARGALSGKDYSMLTRRQLQEWGCKYHDVRFDKPAFDLLIDDKAMNATDL